MHSIWAGNLCDVDRRRPLQVSLRQNDSVDTRHTTNERMGGRRRDISSLVAVTVAPSHSTRDSRSQLVSALPRVGRWTAAVLQCASEATKRDR